MILRKDFQLTDPTSARFALRSASDASHQRMHVLKPFSQISTEALPISKYLCLLESLYLFHFAVRDAADKSGMLALSSANHRLELLISDITLLGGEVPIAVGDWSAGAGQAALGALYVAEGSMLGGRVIARQLDYLFGSQQEGRRFFIGDESDRVNWSRLLLVLEDSCAAPPALKAAIDGAQRTFDWFELCVTAHSHKVESRLCWTAYTNV